MTTETQTEDEHADGGLRSHPLVRLLRVYAWRYRWSYLVGGIFLWVTNYLSVSIPGEIGRAVDALRAASPLRRG